MVNLFYYGWKLYVSTSKQCRIDIQAETKLDSKQRDRVLYCTVSLYLSLSLDSFCVLSYTSLCKVGAIEFPFRTRKMDTSTHAFASSLSSSLLLLSPFTDHIHQSQLLNSILNFIETSYFYETHQRGLLTKGWTTAVTHHLPPKTCSKWPSLDLFQIVRRCMLHVPHCFPWILWYFQIFYTVILIDSECFDFFSIAINQPVFPISYQPVDIFLDFSSCFSKKKEMIKDE